MAVKIFQRLCKTVLSLSNLYSSNFVLKFFNQFYIMLPHFQHIFSNRKTYQKKEKDGSKSKTKGLKTSNKKRDKRF